MIKDTPNHILMNMIGSAQTSREIFEDGDVPIFTVVLITLKALEYKSAPDQDQIIHLLLKVYYNLHMPVHSVPECYTPPMFRGIRTSYGYHM